MTEQITVSRDFILNVLKNTSVFPDNSVVEDFVMNKSFEELFRVIIGSFESSEKRADFYKESAKNWKNSYVELSETCDKIEEEYHKALEKVRGND